MAIFPGLLVVGVNPMLFVPGKTKNGVMNLGSHLCAVIELNLGPIYIQTELCCFSEPLLKFLGV